MSTIKICVIGLAKSGTSALYSSIKAALPKPRRLMFEPRSPGEIRYIWKDETENGLIKLLFGVGVAQSSEVKNFSHRICIVRDPRDILVSSLLFRFNRLNLINNKVLSEKLISAFKQKEADPDSISVVEALELIGEDEARKFAQTFETNLDTYAEFIDANSDNHVIKYEDMIAGRLGALSAYLGFTVRAPERLSGWIEKINRKGEEGDWKNWLCGSDIEFFKPFLSRFLVRFDYDQSWVTNARKIILPEHCSGYIERLSVLRKKDPTVERIVNFELPSLMSAAEDGKTTAMIKLARGIIDRKEAWGDEELAYDLLYRLGEMGRGNEAVEAGRHFLKQGQRKKAMAAFRLGVDADHPAAFYLLGRRLLNSGKPQQIERGQLLIKRGAQLGSTSCKKLLEAESAA